MNEEPDRGAAEEPEGTGPENREWVKPSLLRRIVGLVVGLVAAYVIGFFLTLFFWTGFPIANAIGLSSAALFAVFWLVLTLRLTTTKVGK